MNAVFDELLTVCDLIRWSVSRFGESDLYFGHGADNAFDEAVFIVLESLHLPPDTLEPYWNARLTRAERERIVAVVEDRIKRRIPASYLLRKAYLQGYSFYVDERVIIPRSYIAEILSSPQGFSRIPDPSEITRVLDLCTGSGCLAILAAHLFPNAAIDAVDISADALAVAARNVEDYGLQDRVRMYKGDLFAALPPLASYDLILTNPPYVDAAGMAELPEEYRHEPVLALAAGEDGLEIVHKILAESPLYLNDGGAVLCELGRCGPALECAYPRTPFLWVDTEASSGEVFWLQKQDFPQERISSAASGRAG